MKFDNQTPFPASLDTGSTTDHEQLGMVSCRITYQWDEAGEITPLPAALMWPVNKSVEAFEGTMLLPDSEFRREAIDVLLFGEAIAPGGKPITQMRVGMATGALVQQFDVMGDRVWQKSSSAGPWVASEPKPFVRMPLTCERAYGGRALLNGAQVPYSMNPLGAGYVLEESSLRDGVSLPNIERAEKRIRDWRDTPVPACLHKPAGGLLLAASGPESWTELAQDRQQLQRVLMRQSFQQAPPDFVCPRGGLGAELLMSGMCKSGLTRLALPGEVASTEHGAVAYVEVGQRRAVFALRVVSLIVLLAQRMLIVGFSSAFRYLVQPGEQRRALLRWHGETSFRLGSAA